MGTWLLQAILECSSVTGVAPRVSIDAPPGAMSNTYPTLGIPLVGMGTGGGDCLVATEIRVGAMKGLAMDRRGSVIPHLLDR